MIQFKQLRYKNFLSTGNYFTEIDLVRPSNTLVVGKNGSGKSTMLDALTFVLFGKPFRRVNKPQLVNSINEKGTLVEIDFSIGTKDFMVRRGILPNIFEIWENDVQLPQPAAIKDYQKKLEKNILKMNYKSFTQIVILGSSGFTPFMKLPPHHRRIVIEDILDIGVFSLMNQALKSRAVALKDELQEIDKNLEILLEKIRLQSEYISKIEHSNKERHTEINDKILDRNKQNRELTTEATQTQTRISELITQISKSDEIRKKHRDYINIERDIVRKHQECNHRITFFNENSSCPTCTQSITTDVSMGVINENTTKLSTFNEALEKIKSNLLVLEDTLSNISLVEKNISNENRELQAKMLGIKHNTELIEKLTEERDNLVSTDNLEEEKTGLTNQNEQLEGVRKHKDKIISTKNIYNRAYMMLKDSGIKTKIIEQYLPIMNKLINQYLTEFDFFVNFNLDENFNEEIKSRHRDAFSYDSFSEGEKQRIDLAILFCWREIARMKNSVSTNLLILDELFDSSLDSEGTDDFLKVISVLEKKGDNLFVISHKTDILSEVFEDVIEFEKIGDFSQLKGKE